MSATIQSLDQIMARLDKAIDLNQVASRRGHYLADEYLKLIDEIKAVASDAKIAERDFK